MSLLTSVFHLGFQWKDLPVASIVVDVGGGLGHTTLNIAKEYKHLKFIVQDRPAVIDQAKQVCFIPDTYVLDVGTRYTFPSSTGENRFLQRSRTGLLNYKVGCRSGCLDQGHLSITTFNSTRLFHAASCAERLRFLMPHDMSRLRKD